MPKLVFERKVGYNSGTYRVAIPLEIAKALSLKKGDILAITFEDDHFVCRKKIERD